MFLIAVPEPTDQSPESIPTVENADLPRLRPRPAQAPRAAQGHSSDNTPTSSQGPPGSIGSPGFIPPEEKFNSLNDALKALGCTEANKAKLKFEPNYGSEKLRELMIVSKTLLQEFAGTNTVKLPSSSELEAFEDLIQHFQLKFSEAKTNSERIKVLSAVPPTWTRAKLFEEFGHLGATDHMIRKAKQLVRQKGVLCTPDPKAGRPLSEETVNLITEFYLRDEISSKQMPGRKDYVSMYDANKQKIHQQKRMLLSNLKSLHEAYMNEYKDTNPVSFSKFAQLKPKHCVFAGSPGTHTVCVCVYHENVNLMFEGARLKEFSANSDIQFSNFKDCFKLMMCDDPTPECHLRTCKNCPSSASLKEEVSGILDENMVDSVTYRGWFKVQKRYTLEKVTKSTEMFVETFIDLLEKLLPHHFITKQQSEFYQEKKNNLKPGEVLVVSDFAENYSCVMQDEVQGYHWSTEQVSLHPFVAYYKTAVGDLKCISYVAATDHRKHVTATFHAFQKKFVPFLQAKLNQEGLTVKKIYYFSDGSSAQYKNRKNVKNICCHETDFKIEIEWHFFASCHGKGPCDGVGGTLKRCCLRASLQGAIIRNAMDLCQWAQKNLPNITVDYFSLEEVNTVTTEQEERCKDLETITGIANYHAVIPQSQSSAIVKRYSASLISKVVHLTKIVTLLPWNSLSVSSFILFANDNERKWQLGKIDGKNDETMELTLTSYIPCGRAKWYNISQQDVKVEWKQVLTTAKPTVTKTNRASIPGADKTTADRELKLYQGNHLVYDNNLSHNFLFLF